MRRLAALALVAMMLSGPLATLFFALRSIEPYPGPDFLKVLADWDAYGPAHALWVQIEGHRMVLPRLLLLADLRWAGGANILTATVVLAAQVGMVVGAAVAAMRVAGLAGAALVAVLGLGPYYDLLTDQNHAWVTVVHGLCFAAIAAFWQGVRGDQERWGWLAAAILLSLAAAFSGLPGILAWPAMAWLAVGCRRWRALAVPVLAVAVFIPLFRIGMVPTHGAGDVAALLVAPRHTAEAFALHVGAQIAKVLFVRPFSDYSAAAALAGGLGGIAAAALLLAALLARPNRCRGPAGLVAGLLILAALWLAAAVGKHAQPGHEIAVQSRFLSQSGWFWATLGTLAIGLAGKRGVVAAALVLLATLPSSLLAGLRADTEGAVRQALLAGIRAGVDDPELRGGRNVVAAADPAYQRWLSRRPVPSDSPGQPCPPSTILGRRPVPGGQMVWGEWPPGMGEVRILDADGKPVGLGLPWRAPLLPSQLPSGLAGARDAGWVGYVGAESVDLRVLCRDP